MAGKQAFEIGNGIVKMLAKLFAVRIQASNVKASSYTLAYTPFIYSE